MQRSNITANDILCGRGGLTNSHVGNKLFRKIVDGYQGEYLNARKMEKKGIAKRIVSQIHNNGGRFLKQNNDYWTEVPENKALEKTSQALREGLDVRNNKVRKNKLYHHRKRRTRLVEGLVVNTKTNCSDDDSNRRTTGSNNNAIYRGMLKSTVAFVRQEDGDGVPELVQAESVEDDSGGIVPELVQSASVDEGGYGPELVRGQSSSSLARAFEPMFTFFECENMK